MVKLRRPIYAGVLGPNGGTFMFTYILIAAAAVLVVAAVWYQIRTRNTRGRYITQNAPMGDPGVADAKNQHDVTTRSQGYGNGR